MLPASADTPPAKSTLVGTGPTSGDLDAFDCHRCPQPAPRALQALRAAVFAPLFAGWWSEKP
eukprot:14493616-Alexandrium_andersonii.AAC.1